MDDGRSGVNSILPPSIVSIGIVSPFFIEQDLLKDVSTIIGKIDKLISDTISTRDLLKKM